MPQLSDRNQCNECKSAIYNALSGRHKTEHNMKSICRAALLNDNAPDSELYLSRVRVHSGSNNFRFLYFNEIN